ncbi:DEKNAAC101627 [Brettanomyces naardenensis]|uniref:Protein ROT1 n=1 Tax=Brettanomyces naardenensis TaxID=13370 RepID=A0A448YIM8_BRENA|nr:DEKNAAC101627 [Brettanomyces naardenensis]
MLHFITSLLVATVACVLADDGASIVGTWTTKSNSVFTGPGFFDPIDELIIEPALPGISYSFTEDGYFEEAIYQVTPNPQNHSCAVAAVIYQHGTYTVNGTGSLTLTPIAVDGRQLLSQPCQDNGVSTYSRYNQTEKFNGYSVYVDPYHGRWRLDLTESNGVIMQPLYLAYRPPQMLPTITLNPTESAPASAFVGDGDGSGTFVQNTATAVATGSKVKRDEGTAVPIGLSQKVKRSLENRYRTNAVRKSGIDYGLWWWSCLLMVVVGGVMFVAT